MKRKIFNAVLGAGWVLLGLFLVSTYFLNKFSDKSKSFSFKALTWQNHMQLFEGAVQCNLMGDSLLERKRILREKVFSEVVKKDSTEYGLVYYFEDQPELLDLVLEHVLIEKECCPFFKFDISILPFKQGFALQLSGSDAAIEMLKEFETGKF